MLLGLGAYSKRLFFRLLAAKSGLCGVTEALKLQHSARRLRVQRAYYAGACGIGMCAAGVGLNSKLWCVSPFPPGRPAPNVMLCIVYLERQRLQGGEHRL
jgi:hypothetical protein